MIKKELDSVKLFHKKFNIDYFNEPKANIPEEIKELRFKLMEEENIRHVLVALTAGLVIISSTELKKLLNFFPIFIISSTPL